MINIIVDFFKVYFYLFIYFFKCLTPDFIIQGILTAANFIVLNLYSMSPIMPIKKMLPSGRIYLILLIQIKMEFLLPEISSKLCPNIMAITPEGITSTRQWLSLIETKVVILTLKNF